MRRVYKNAISRSVLLTLLAFSPAWAQVTPGQVQDTLKFPVPIAPQAPGVMVEKPKQETPQAPGGRTVQVIRFVFVGNTVFSQAELSAQAADYLNKPITLLDIYSAADKITDFYADHGYSLASVNVPPQKLTGGEVRLDVNEGVIGRITVDGASGERADNISGFLGDAHSGSIYHGPRLERGLQQLNELPGLSARAVVQPGTDYGSTDLVIKIKEPPVSGNFFVDNYGTRQIGQTRFAANVLINNPGGIEDQLNLLGLRSNDGLLLYGFVGYSVPLNFDGTRLNLSYGHANFEVPGAIDGHSSNGKVEVAQPLIRQRENRLDVAAGISRTDSTAELPNSTFLPLSGTSITLLELSGSYNHVYKDFAVTQVTANISSNFDHASSAAEVRPVQSATVSGKAQSAAQRFRLELDAQHLQPLAGKLFLILHANGAWSPDPLSNATQYSLGGPQSIRGFPTSEIRGDRGFFGQITLGRPFDAGPVRLTSRAFVDGGKVFCAEAAADCQVVSLTSAGVGADASYDRVSAKLDYSHPLDSHVAGDGRTEGRVYGSLFVNF